MLEAAEENERNKLIIKLLYGTGIRNEALCKLKMDYIYPPNSYFVIKNGKGGKDREIAVHRRLNSDIIEFMGSKTEEKAKKGYLFLNNRLGKNKSHLSTRTIERIVKKLAKKANIKKHITPHTFRRTWATLAYRNGTPL